MDAQQEQWKIIPSMERYIINKDGTVMNRFTKKVIFPLKSNMILLTKDDNTRACRSPSKIAKQLFSKGA